MKISKIMMSCFLSIALMATSLSCYSVSAISSDGSDVDSFTITSNTTNIETITVNNELYFNSEYDYVPVEVGLNTGIELAGYDDVNFYEVGDSPIEFTVDDEKIAKIGIVQGVGVNVLGVSAGETMLNAKVTDGRTASIKVIVKDVPSTSTTAVWNEAMTTTTTVSNELYFNSEYDYVPVEIGLNTGIEIAGYDDEKFYEVGNSPIEFTIDDEQIAKIGIVQGIGVNVLGVSAGQTILNAKAPDGRTASIKVVVRGTSSTSTTAVLDITTTTTTTVAEVDSPLISVKDILGLAQKGDALSWGDFEKYAHTDVGSGLIVWEFNIKDDSSKLLIGGGSLDENPVYIRLQMSNGTTLDVRNDDLTPWYYDDGSFMMGDVNADGDFNISDVVLLQKWLLAVPDTNLANWKAADFCKDNKLDVFDLCLMKRTLIYDVKIPESVEIELKSRYSEYGLGNPKVEFLLTINGLPSPYRVDDVELYDEQDQLVSAMSPCTDVDVWECVIPYNNITEEGSKTFFAVIGYCKGEINLSSKTRTNDVVIHFSEVPAP